MTIHCMQVREMIRRSDHHRVPEVAHLLEGTVYDLPEHTVTVTDISEINLDNRSGASVNSDVKVKRSRLVFINSVLFVIPFSLIMTAPVYLSGLHHVYMYTSSRQLCFSSDYVFHMLRPKQMDIAPFPVLLLLCRIPCPHPQLVLNLFQLTAVCVCVCVCVCV